MRFPILSVLCLFLLAAGAHADGQLITKESNHDVRTTADRLEAAVNKAGATVFARVNHAGGAEKVGMELQPMEVLIFGNPKLGTPIIQAAPEAGLDLPIKVLVWQDGEKVMIGYLDPQALKARYGVLGADKSFEMMTGALGKLTDAAAAAE
ncbi:MAG TPA: DUF302 domain-containing protein [Afifellaceae bacterium]|nr:DUF302 domain-containing protein [Afifellaceae bacterium]